MGRRPRRRRRRGHTLARVQADIDDEAESLAPRSPRSASSPAGSCWSWRCSRSAIHAVPFERAAGKLGALYSSADATPFDAFRVASLVRQLEPQVVVGITGSVLDGLVDAGAIRPTCSAPVPAVVAADDDAHARLRAVGLTPRRSVRLGPTTAIEGLDADGPVYDAPAGTSRTDDGELAGQQPRAAADRVRAAPDRRPRASGRRPGALSVSGSA